MKRIKFIGAMLLGIAMLIGVAGCGKGMGEIDALQSRIEEMEDRIEKLEKELREMQSNNILYNRLDSTEKQLAYRTSSMAAYSVEDAYENGLLTKRDLANAMYYACGKVYVCEKSDWENNNMEAVKKLDFSPEDQCPAINGQVESDIKKHYFEREHFEEDLTFEEFAQNFSFRFVGSYKGTFVITSIETDYWNYPADVPPPVWIGGFVWSGSYENDLYAFRYE